MMDMSGIFRDVANQMRSDIDKARKALNHAGLKGSAFEETFRNFLREYLPRSLDVSTGQIIDSHGRFSRQLDIIISDASKTPILFRSGDLRVVPVECVYAVVEVKAFLDKGELEGVYTNMESVRRLQKTAYNQELTVVERNVQMYGQQWAIWPVNYYVFAYDSIGLSSLTRSVHEITQLKSYALYSQIDMICVLDKGNIVNQLVDGTYDALPAPFSRIQYIETEHALLLFYVLISRYIHQTWLPNFRFVDYIKEMTFGKGEVN